MSTTGLRNGTQDIVAGVTTRARSRLRDETDASSPAGDLHDRRRRRPQPASVPLRRSPRQAAIVASRAEKQNIPTRHPEPATETPSTSSATSSVGEGSDPPTLREEECATDQDTQSADRRIFPGTRDSASSPLPQDVEIIDLTDSRTGRKRKWSTVTIDDGVSVDTEDRVADNKVQRVTSGTYKKAKLDEHNDELVVEKHSGSRARSSSPIPARKQNTNTVAENPSTAHERSHISIQTLVDVGAHDTAPFVTQAAHKASEVIAPQLLQCVCHVHGATGESEISAADESQRLCQGSKSTQALERGCGSRGAEETVVAHEALSHAELKSECPHVTTSVNNSPVPSGPSSTGQSIDQGSSSSRYFGIDGRLWRSRKPPSSYLAPNPVRRPPRSPTLRRDECRYLSHATERAGMYTFTQTRRQFPRWMQRPSHIYFRGSEFFPRGRPITEHDIISEIDIEMDFDDDPSAPTTCNIDNDPSAPTTCDIFQLYPSTSTDSMSQMELDPDLDPSSLLNGQSSLYGHGAAGDFLGPGPDPYSMQFSTGGPFQPPPEQFWYDLAADSQAQQPFASELALAGPSNESALAFQAEGIEMFSGDAQVQGDAQELLFDPSSWADVPQFSFVPPPLHLPPQNMSLDSSLSAMASYLVNDTPPLRTSLDPTTLNVIDGVPPVTPPWQSYFAAHPTAQPVDGDGAGDGQHVSPLN